MIKYKILDNTADILIRVYGEDSATILSNSIYALASLLHRVGIRINAEHTETIKAEITPYVIVDMMNLVISEFEMNRILYFACELQDSILTLKGHMFTRSIKPKNSVKAATYHNLPARIVPGYLDITLDI
ncbi:MAG: archease [Thermoplasmata archaeon]